MSEKRCYTVQELQEILGVSRPTIFLLLILSLPPVQKFPLLNRAPLFRQVSLCHSPYGNRERHFFLKPEEMKKIKRTNKAGTKNG